MGKERAPKEFLYLQKSHQNPLYILIKFLLDALCLAVFATSSYMSSTFYSLCWSTLIFFTTGMLITIFLDQVIIIMLE